MKNGIFWKSSFNLDKRQLLPIIPIMKNKDLIQDAIESLDKSLQKIDLILANGTIKNILTWEDRYDQIKQMRDEMDNQPIVEY